jgi:membrane protein DedA with SNARE-associated domain
VEWLVYLTAFVGPFVQEDAAVWGAVTAFEHPAMDTMAHGSVIVGCMLAGLIVSDLWKYWIGHFARRHAWAARLAQKPAVAAMGDRMKAKPGLTLLIARFVPGTRIPAYVAAGVFGVPFAVFAGWIVASALAYTFVAWAMVATVGQVAGEHAMVVLAGMAIAGVAMWLIVAWLRRNNAT